jgi:hypothetical protein
VRNPPLFAALAAALFWPLLAPGQQPAVRPVSDWRTEWRRERNRLIDTDPTPTSDPTSILIQFRPDADPALIDQFLAQNNLRTIDTFPILPGLHHVQIGEHGSETIEFVERSGRAAGLVVYAEPDRISRAQELPGDPSLAELWGLHNTGQVISPMPARGMPTSMRHGLGTRSAATKSSSSPSSIRAFGELTRIWPRTSGPTPARSSTGSTMTATVGSMTSGDGTLSTTTTTPRMTTATARTAQGRWGPGATTAAASSA